jgi:hypothetical protein
MDFFNTRFLKQEEQAAAEVLEDFVSSFDNSGKSVAKMFVKGTVINPTSKGKSTL